LGALIALADRKGKRNVVAAAIRMMRSLSERGSESFGLATPNEVLLCDSLPRLSDQRIDSSVVIGYNLNRIFSKDIPQPLESRELRLALEGRIYPTSQVSDCRRALSSLEEKPNVEPHEFTKEIDGSYAMAMLYGGQLLVARDLLGCKPLYWEEANKTVAFASERKALWALGIESPHRFPPGGIGVVREEVVSIQEPDVRTPFTKQEIDLDSAARRLSELIVESIRRRAGDLKRVAVAYSGGLDSAVVASSSRLAGLDVELFTVTARSNGEFEHAKKTARELGFPFMARQYSLEDVSKAIPQVLQRMERPNMMDVAIAVPVFWACQLAEEAGFHVIFMGQGADELFGGYDRYISTYQRLGLQEASRMMTKDVLNLSELSFERDEQLSAGTRVELRLPFADRELMRFVLSLPPSLKIGGVEESRQKLVLRQVARLQKIPSSVSDKPKRAMQYATGVAASIRVLARNVGMAPQEYVLETYNEMRKKLRSHTLKSVG